MENTDKIFGVRAIIEAIQSGQEIDKVLISKDGKSELISELIKVIKKNNVNFSYVPIEKLNKFSSKNHQGAIASISPISFYSLEELIDSSLQANDYSNPIFLILDQLSDTRNFGAIVRTAECTGVSGIIIPKTGSAPINADTVKTSAGAIFNIPICKVDHIKDAIYYMQSSQIQIVAATEKTDQTIYDISLDKPTAIIMGSEGKGINPSILKIVDIKAKLPMFGKISSLNVSVACGAFLYEAIRQRNT